MHPAFTEQSYGLHPPVVLGGAAGGAAGAWSGDQPLFSQLKVYGFLWITLMLFLLDLDLAHLKLSFPCPPRPRPPPPRPCPTFSEFCRDSLLVNWLPVILDHVKASAAVPAFGTYANSFISSWIVASNLKADSVPLEWILVQVLDAHRLYIIIIWHL